MWRLETHSLARGVIGAVAQTAGVRMTFSQVISRWRNDETFIAEWVTQLAAIALDAYCFETPPLTKTILNESKEKRPGNSGGKWRRAWMLDLQIRLCGSARQDSVYRGSM